MSTPANKVIYVELDIKRLDPAKFKDLITGILQVAPNASLYATNPILQASLAALQQASDAFEAADATVIAGEAKLLADKQARSDAWGALVTKVTQYRGIVQTTATKVSEVTDMGLTALTRASKGVVAVPTGIDIFYPKKGRGRVKVTAQVINRTDRHGCQICLDPLTENTWTDLDGDGRSHWLTGYKSGTMLWVRFRAVRGHVKSDWCNPVAVTIV